MPHTDRSPSDLRTMFGENLRKLTRRHASVSTLTKELGINRTQFNRYLSGESFPRPDILDRICRFFDVDARILLEPLEVINQKADPLTGSVLADFIGAGVTNVPERSFPSGFYRFMRRSFVDNTLFVSGLVFVFRDSGGVFVRGYEPKAAMQAQGLAVSSRDREFRGFVSQQEDGFALLMSRRDAMTSSFNYLSRVASFAGNFWAGYATRTARESVIGHRAVRMVYEFLDHDRAEILGAARAAGFLPEGDLPRYHRSLLLPEEPFR